MTPRLGPVLICAGMICVAGCQGGTEPARESTGVTATGTQAAPTTGEAWPGTLLSPQPITSPAGIDYPTGPADVTLPATR